MKRMVLLAVVAACVPSLAWAHISVRPRESKPAVDERYTVRVPTEGAVATTHVRVEIPAGVTVLEVIPQEGATFETEKAGGRVTAITWTKGIPPAQSAEFVFRARNPASGDIMWKAHQHFADGSAAHWVGAPGTQSPAPITKLVAAASDGAPQAGGPEAGGIRIWLTAYDKAFNAKDLAALAVFYHPDVTIYEGGGINSGWIDYRDNHLAPELESFQNLQFAHSNIAVTVLPGAQSAYATSEYSLKARMGEREIDSRGLETVVLVKGPDGNWKIRHAHTSSRPARRPAAQ